MKAERRLQLEICHWLKVQYPNLIFWANDSGEKKTIGLAKLSKRMRSGSKIPDLWISEARGNFFGLYIELKTEEVLNRKGQYKSPHIKAQANMLNELEVRGYKAVFGMGFTHTQGIIINYMKLPEPKHPPF